MKLCLKIIAIAVIAATTYSMIGCGAPATYSYSNVTVALTSRCADCLAGSGTGDRIIFDPQHPGVQEIANNNEGGDIYFTANVTNAPPTSNVTWNVYPVDNVVPLNNGYFIAESGSTGFFWGQNTPIYTGAALAQANSMKYTVTYQVPSTSLTGVLGYTTVVDQETGIPQGDVLLSASVPDNPDDPSSVATGYQLLEYFGNGSPNLYLTPHTPTSPTGITTSVLSIPHSTVTAGTTPGVTQTYQFYGGAVGAAPCVSATNGGLCSNGSPEYTMNNNVTWQVGPNIAAAVTGGSPTYGTITQAGLYTAPTSVPPTQPVIVMFSQYSPSENMYAYITIQ